MADLKYQNPGKVMQMIPCINSLEAITKTVVHNGGNNMRTLVKPNNTPTENMVYGYEAPLDGHWTWTGYCFSEDPYNYILTCVEGGDECTWGKIICCLDVFCPSHTGGP